MTSMRDGSIPRHRTISRFEKSDSVITRVARRAESHVNVRRRTPSRHANHSGCAANETSWMTSAVGGVPQSGHV